MRYCKKPETLLFGLALLFAVCLARAADITALSARLVTDGETYSLSADFDIDLSRRIEDAINKGVMFYFVADFALTRPRWYWFDKKIVQISRTFQLSYHALTRQYRLSSGALHQDFHSLEDALWVLSRLRWQIAQKGEIDYGLKYVANLRLRLDPSQMPKTFQVNALSGRDWSLSSDWRVWEFLATPPPPPPPPPPPSLPVELPAEAPVVPDSPPVETPTPSVPLTPSVSPTPSAPPGNAS